MDEDILIEIQEKETLHWSYRNYEELPQELEHGIQVQDLYMKHNKLKKLPNWISKLVNLSILQLHGNKLQELPDELGLLLNLHKLDVGCNCLRLIPTTIKNLKCLNELNLENNSLVKLPLEFGLLTALNVLILSNNKIVQLPNTIGCCSNLQELHLQSNNIENIPNSIICLPNLKLLRLENNKLLYFPAIVFFNKPLINFSNNRSLNYIPYEFYVHLTDIQTNWMNSLFFRNTHSYFTCGAIESNHSYYNHVPNSMVEFLYCGKKIAIILPETLKKVLWYKNNYNHIPSLREMLLNVTYKHTPSANKTLYYYEMKANHLPKEIKEIFINGPTAKCNHCKNFIFTECIIWVLPRLLRCTVCFETDILTVVYFCSTRCINLYKNEEYVSGNESDKLSTLLLNWIRIK
ncbi:uncharacterized protein LOC142318373 [Lycorma delicatula]|uniref:uncharacterized protein LOC142318373 n=1 Tax=Lycorma delicatula TaxID=130591 RepID=UPI003F516845